jgi:hypothetical protein
MLGRSGGRVGGFWSCNACKTPKLVPRISSVRPTKPKPFEIAKTVELWSWNTVARSWDWTPAINAPLTEHQLEEEK